MQIYDVLVVGAGPVGLYATYMSGYLKMSTLCVEIDKEIGGLPAKIFPTKTIPNFPYFNDQKEFITGQELIDGFKQKIDKNPEFCSIKTNFNIVEIKKDNDIFCITNQNGEKIYSKFIIFTTGKGSWTFKKIDPEIITHEFADIHYKLNDLSHYDGKEVVILGGGDGAVDYSKIIKSKSNPKNVTLIHHKNTFSTPIGCIDSLAKCGINTFMNFKIKEISKDNIIIEDNETQEQKTINFQTVLVQYGIDTITNNNIIDIFETHNNQFVIDEKYETSIKNIYAAGACIKQENRINMIMMGISEVTIILNKIKSLLPESTKVLW